ncbi:MAG: PSD1 and planctomycete cytochrome C domain-containing protein [Pirellula sp.]
MMAYPPDLPNRFTGLCVLTASLQYATVFIVAILSAAMISNAQESKDEEQKKSERRQEASLRDVEFFEKNVRPLLAKHCYECHSGEERNGGLRLDFRETTQKGGDSGSPLAPGNPDASLLIKAVRYNNQDLQMPPKGPLAASEVAILEEWIASGAHDPRTMTNTEGQPMASPKGMSIESGRQFWSLLPIANPKPPSNKTSEWAKTPIDQFILDRLERENLQPAPTADRASLIRRVTLDLTGIPPTADEIEAFTTCESPNAYAELIDRLLASPQYGVHWGRHWLDVARYADSNGLDENIAFGNAWRYRDYVIQCFNADKPIDQFFVENIAGDLVPDSSLESITGTGFLVLGAKVLAEPDREKLVMDTIDEQLDTIGKAFMGMTMGCARCHDHKFDPIKQVDYYALAAIFKSTKTFGDTNFGAIKHWHEISFADQVERESLKKVNAEIAKHQAALSAFKSSAFNKLRTQVRGQAADYLVAATKIAPDMTLQDVAAIAEPMGLHPRVLFQCRRQLSFQTEHPLFLKWHELLKANDASQMGEYYRDLFQRTEAAFADAKKKDPATKKLDDPELEMARAELYNLTGFLAIPPKPEFAFDEETLKEIGRLATEARLAESFAPDESAVMGVNDGQVLTGLPIHIRGSHRNLGDVVPRDFPEVMRPPHESPILSRKQSGRLEFARWLTSPNHPLTARVFVNRVWRWHFGKGLVETTENFGALGDRPSHPELLDYLARSFVESGWSMKELHRLILRSSTFQMSVHNEASETASMVDPENRLLWRFHPQRMTAEQIRDSILLVCGQLDLRMDGKSVPLRNRQFVFDHTSIDNTRYDSLRRAAFLPVIRNNVYTWFEQFDFPDPTMPTGSRNTTTVAPQALLLMNSELVINAAKRLTSQVCSSVSSPKERIELLYREVYGRKASAPESERAIAFIASGSTIGESLSDGGAVQENWFLLSQSLLLSNEFVFIK